MLIQVKHVKPAYQEEAPPQIIVDGKNYPFYLDEIEFKPVSRQDWMYFKELVEALSSSKQKLFVVEFPKYNKSKTFSLLDARKALGHGNTSILAGCDEPN